MEKSHSDWATFWGARHEAWHEKRLKKGVNVILSATRFTVKGFLPE
jgi:hypothetical protein